MTACSCNTINCGANNTYDLDPGIAEQEIAIGGLNAIKDIRPNNGYPGAFDGCPTNTSTTNCKTNRIAYCFQNYCAWYATACTTNEPLFSNGNACPTYTNELCPAQDGLLVPIDRPALGQLITNEQLEYLRKSIKGEFANRRWVITDVSDPSDPLDGDDIDSVDFSAMKTYVESIINRTAHEYDFYTTTGILPSCATNTNALFGTLAPTNGYTVTGGYSPGSLVNDTHITELYDMIDQIRTDCICVQNCICFGDCTCNWNCSCNYR